MWRTMVTVGLVALTLLVGIRGFALGSGMVMLILAILPVFGALDAALHPESAWRRADQNKVVWVALQLGGLMVFFLPGVLASLAYFIAIRPGLSAARRDRTASHIEPH